MRQASISIFCPSFPPLCRFLAADRARSQGIIPVFRGGAEPEPVAANDLPLRIGISCGNQHGIGTAGQRAHVCLCCRRPAAAGAEVKAPLPKAFETCKAHGINRRLGGDKPEAVTCTKSEQDLGAAIGETAPICSPLLPDGHEPLIIDMRRPHAAVRPFSQSVLIHGPTKDLLGNSSDVPKIGPGW